MCSATVTIARNKLLDAKANTKFDILLTICKDSTEHDILLYLDALKEFSSSFSKKVLNAKVHNFTPVMICARKGHREALEQMKILGAEMYHTTVCGFDTQCLLHLNDGKFVKAFSSCVFRVFRLAYCSGCRKTDFMVKEDFFQNYLLGTPTFTIHREFRRCGSCRCFAYCSRECQLKHWREGHKDECANYKAEMAHWKKSELTCGSAYRLEHCIDKKWYGKIIKVIIYALDMLIVLIMSMDTAMIMLSMSINTAISHNPRLLLVWLGLHMMHYNDLVEMKLNF
jgi:hypothetical protein